MKTFTVYALAAASIAALGSSAAPAEGRAYLTVSGAECKVESSDAAFTASVRTNAEGRVSMLVSNPGGAKEVEVSGWEDFPLLPRLYLGVDKSIRPKRALPPADGKLLFRMAAGSCAFVTTDYTEDDLTPGPVRTMKARVDPAKPLLMVPVYSEIIPCTTFKCNYGYTVTDVSVDGTNVFTFTSDRPAGAETIFHSPIDLSKWAGRDIVISRRDCWCENPEDSFRGWHFASRDALPDDLGNESYRPQFHFTARWGWTNDPNGLSYYGGKWHLFYQAVPCSTLWRPSNRWGHAVSDDLVNWREVLPAIEPDFEGAAWSGSAVTDREGVAGYGKGAHIAFYTRHPWNAEASHYQVLAYSTDGANYRTGPCIIPPTTDGARDPFVFYHEESAVWVLILNEEPPDEFGYTIWNSSNLRNWKKVGYIKGDPKGGNIPVGTPKRCFLSECPWMAHVKVEGTDKRLWVVGGGDAVYQVGNFDGRTFTPLQEPRTPFPLRVGPGKSLAWQKPYYAGQVFNDAPDGRVVYIPWYKLQTPPRSRFSQAMGLPLEFTLARESDGKYRLRFAPVAELKSLRSGDAVPFERFRGELLEFEYAADLSSDARVEFDLRGVRLVYDAKTQELRVGDSVKTSWPLSRGRLELHGWLDRCGIEVFSKDFFSVLPDPAALPDPARDDISVVSSGASGVKTAAWRLRRAGMND